MPSDPDREDYANLAKLIADTEKHGLVRIFSPSAPVEREPLPKTPTERIDHIFAHIYETGDPKTRELPQEKFDEFKKFVSECSPRCQQAFELAAQAHHKKIRNSGEPYIFHVIEVAKILVEQLKITSDDAVSAAFLHDVIEDNLPTNYEDRILKEFGGSVLDKVLKLTKFKIPRLIPKLKKDGSTAIVFDGVVQDDITHGNLFGYGNPDRDVLLIKIADRWQNAETFNMLPTLEKRIENAKETRDVYIPLAIALGQKEAAQELSKLITKILDGDLDPRPDRSTVLWLRRLPKSPVTIATRPVEGLLKTMDKPEE